MPGFSVAMVFKLKPSSKILGMSVYSQVCFIMSNQEIKLPYKNAQKPNKRRTGRSTKSFIVFTSKLANIKNTIILFVCPSKIWQKIRTMAADTKYRLNYKFQWNKMKFLLLIKGSKRFIHSKEREPCYSINGIQYLHVMTIILSTKQQSKFSNLITAVTSFTYMYLFHIFQRLWCYGKLHRFGFFLFRWCL